MLSYSNFGTSFRPSIAPTRYPINGTSAYTLNRKLDLTNRDVLFLAEGNMTFAESWIAKHEDAGEVNVSSRLICSELMTHDQMHKSPEVKKTIDWFEKKGGQFVYSLDCTLINQVFEGHNFVRIQMNCPHDRSDYYAIPKTLPPLMSGFFQASKEIQSENGTVHVTLLQPEEDEFDDRWKLYQGHHFEIVKAAEGTGVQFETAIPFDNERYPGYRHQMTYSTRGASNAPSSREFVFLRGDSKTRTSHDRIDFEYIRLPAGAHRGEFYNCTYYTPYTNERRSYSQLPSMQGENTTVAEEAFMCVEDGTSTQAGVSMRG